MSRRKKADKEQRAQKRGRKRGERRASRKNRQYLAWNHLTRNQKEVAQRIMAGDYRRIGPAGWGFLDKFLIFIKTIGFLECLDVSGEGYVRRMITIAKLLLTYQMKILMGIRSMNQVPQLLFGDIGLSAIFAERLFQTPDWAAFGFLSASHRRHIVTSARPYLCLYIIAYGGE